MKQFYHGPIMMTFHMVDQEWYNDNIEHKLSLCFYIAYRMFRVAHNEWTKGIAGEWMRNKKIFLKYIQNDSIPIMRRNNHKGFVYSNICHQVSNFMTGNVSLLMQINHKE